MMTRELESAQGVRRRTAATGAGIGCALVLASSFAGADWHSAGSLGLLVPFVLWALVPYGALLLMARLPVSPWVIAGAAGAAIAADLGIRLAVFVFPRGSTAAIALVFSPLVLTVACLPGGALLGYVVGRAVASARRWLAAVALAGSVAALALVTLGFARPDLFPTTVYARQQALSRIGATGVRVGGDRFTRRSISSASAWRLTGEFDGVPGDEIALVREGTVQLLDGRTFAAGDRLPLAGEAARWNWFSQLARVDGRLVRVDGGGGFQDTRVWALDGTLLLEYRPDAALPPSALRAGDLDGDGETEFYATTMRELVRLDVTGRVAWRQPLSGASISTLVPGSSLGPGWVVTVTDGRAATAWGSDGQALGSVASPGQAAPVLGVVEWLDRRLVAFGGPALTLRGLDGTTAFEWPVPDMSAVSVATARFAASEPPLLLLVAAADRDVHRCRVQLVDRARTLVYDEVTEVMPQLLTAAAADGTTTILLGGAELGALQPLP